MRATIASNGDLFPLVLRLVLPDSTVFLLQVISQLQPHSGWHLQSLTRSPQAQSPPAAVWLPTALERLTTSYWLLWSISGSAPSKQEGGNVHAYAKSCTAFVRKKTNKQKTLTIMPPRRLNFKISAVLWQHKCSDMAIVSTFGNILHSLAVNQQGLHICI